MESSRQITVFDETCLVGITALFQWSHTKFFIILIEVKGLSPMADLMPGGGVEATVFILEGLPRCSTPPILTHIFRIWHRF